MADFFLELAQHAGDRVDVERVCCQVPEEKETLKSEALDMTMFSHDILAVVYRACREGGHSRLCASDYMV